MDLSKISATEKREFLAKLQSGKFILKSGHEKQDSKNFERLDKGLYHCKESGEDLSRDEIEVLASGYDISIVLVDTREQVAGIEPPDGYQFSNINYGDDKALNNLLIPKE